MATNVFRVYTRDDSFTNPELIPKDLPQYVSEIQVVLTFATDYDGETWKKGHFRPSWETETVTPELVANFKKNFPTAKVLVSIGNDKKPFKVVKGEEAAWIEKATSSLIIIIKDYNLDGIDVYYEKIPQGDADLFVHCVGEVIKNLKAYEANRFITRASISPTNVTLNPYYWPFYKLYGSYIDDIVFQCFITSSAAVEGNVPDQIRNCQGLLEQLKNDFPQKLLLGYTNIHGESPPYFFIFSFLALSRGRIKGASIRV